MSRPKSKVELLQKSKEEFNQLMEFTGQLPKEERSLEFPKGTLNRNIRDVLTHLHQWHLMLLEWYNIGMSGKQPDMPAPGFTWKETPQLNKAIREKYKTTLWDEAIRLLKESHMRVLRIIESHSDTELFEKKYYPWTGSTSLGAYLISSTSSHYEWALKLITKSRKEMTQHV
jgi:hypothetical protein